MNELLSLWDLYQRQNEIITKLNSHSHDASNLTGFEKIAITGKFEDLKELPNLVNIVNNKSGNVKLTAEDVNAIPSNASCNKNWIFEQKNTQPKYLWGCDNDEDMYIFDPKKFTVGFANESGTAISAIWANKCNIAGRVDKKIKMINKNNEVIEFNGSQNIDLTEGINHSNTASSLINEDGLKYTLDELLYKINNSGGDIVGKKISFSETKNLNIANTTIDVLTYENEKGGMIRWNYSTSPTEGTNTYLTVDDEIILDAVPTNILVSNMRNSIDSNNSRFFDIPFEKKVELSISASDILDESFILYNGFTFYENK